MRRSVVRLTAWILLTILHAPAGSRASPLAENPPAAFPAEPQVSAPRPHDAVLILQVGDRRGLGLLLDSSGLVLTSYLLVRDAPDVVVHLDAERRILAQTLASDRGNEVSVLRIHPHFVAPVGPLSAWTEAIGLLAALKSGQIALGTTVREGEECMALAYPPGSPAPLLVRGHVREKVHGGFVHDAPTGLEGLGGPVLNGKGAIMGIGGAPLQEGSTLSRAVRIKAAARALREAVRRIDQVELPPAALLPTVTGSVAPKVGAEAAPAEPDLPAPSLAEYRLRAGNVGFEFLPASLLQSLSDRAASSPIFGDLPWQWSQVEAPEPGLVIVQVIPDLRWTGGSYFRVAGRVVSYPLLVGLYAALFFIFLFCALFSGESGFPDFFIPLAPLWRPVHAAYHFEGDFFAARLLRNGTPVPALRGGRHCETSKVWMARKPQQERRWRTIRGCWGSYAFPVEAFGPGAEVEIQLLEEGRKKPAFTVALDHPLLNRIQKSDPPRTDDPSPAGPPGP